MTEKQAQKFLVLMATKFKIPAPKLIWSGRATRGTANYYQYSVTVGPKCLCSTLKNILIHEFAHFLIYQRSNCAEPCSPNGRITPHNWQFVDALIDCATVCYGNPAHYDWDTEYRSIQASINKRFPEWKIKNG